MKLLYVTSPFQDYLADGLLIGLKNIEDVEVFDYPINRFIYKNDLAFNKHQSILYGRGFSLYNILAPQNDTNSFIPFHPQKISQEFDLVVFSSVWHQFGLLIQWYPYIKKSHIVLIDGHDAPNIFPLLGHFIKQYKWESLRWSRFRYLKTCLYFKRELIGDYKYWLNYKIPDIIHIFINFNKIKPISFCIPSDKLVPDLKMNKSRLFQSHIVDSEVASYQSDGDTLYKFSSEEEYYENIRSAKYGITTKRSGWDCMRHYEIAANGTVICFKNLDKKPSNCAPHGLVHGYNCISYENYSDLMAKISQIDEHSYNNLQKNCYEWARMNTCNERAKQFLKDLRYSFSLPL